MLKWTRLLIGANQRSNCLRYTTAANKVIKTCIVGGGPAGFYSAQYLLKHLPNSQVDLIEKLPTPFGLVRFGVAPDHPEVKNVINTFTKTAEHQKFRYYGNLELGKDISLEELRNSYDIVLLTYGADVDAKLNIPGEDKNHVISAREFVGWYNGLPGLQGLNPDLSGENVLLLGQGNVAVDVARVLLSPLDDLRKTDITEYALEALSRSRVKNVYFVGRRGPLQAAFTIKELREMLKLSGVDTIWRPSDFIGAQEQIDKLPRPKRRITELMLKSLSEGKCEEVNKKFFPIFYRSPTNINHDTVDFTVTKLENDKAISTADTESLPAQLVCRSIGYKSTSVDDSINFDEKRGRVWNVEGRVLLRGTANPDPALYVAGWLATGPSGAILTTMNISFTVAQTIVKDVQSGAITLSMDKPGLDVKGRNVVGWSDWLKIDRKEVEDGQKLNKPREKITSVEEMMKIVN